jgi:hypothetical protein
MPLEFVNALSTQRVGSVAAVFRSESIQSGLDGTRALSKSSTSTTRS